MTRAKAITVAAMAAQTVYVALDPRARNKWWAVLGERSCDDIAAAVRAGITPRNIFTRCTVALQPHVRWQDSGPLTAALNVFCAAYDVLEHDVVELSQGGTAA